MFIYLLSIYLCCILMLGSNFYVNIVDLNYIGVLCIVL